MHGPTSMHCIVCVCVRVCVHIPISLIGLSLFKHRLHHFDYLWDMICRSTVQGLGFVYERVRVRLQLLVSSSAVQGFGLQLGLGYG